jgi:hypothetical protein
MDDKEREVIHLDQLSDFYIPEGAMYKNSDDHLILEELIIECYDLDKRTASGFAIYQRHSDGKYFKIEYIDSYLEGHVLEEKYLEEVFPTNILTKQYK